MFRLSYPETGKQPNLNDDFRGLDYCNHGIHHNNTEDKYTNKGVHSISADTLIEVQTNKYKGNK